MVGKHRKVYVHFKTKNRNLTSGAAKQHLADIFAGTTLYRTITDPLSYPHKNEAINQLLISIGSTRMETSTPFILSVLRAQAAGTLGDDMTRAILRETLVLLVRRKVTELATTQYDVMFPSLLGKMVNEPNPIKVMQERFKQHDVLVSDEGFEDAVINKTAYRRNDLAFSRMLLMEIDKKLQSYGQLPDYSTVGTIEHMIPQTLDDRWKKYLGAEAEDD